MNRILKISFSENWKTISELKLETKRRWKQQKNNYEMKIGWEIKLKCATCAVANEWIGIIKINDFLFDLGFGKICFRAQQ